MSKQDVLELLENNKGSFLSGEEIASKLRLSRNAIWRSVCYLREEGYDIKAVKKRGYLLDPCSDILSVFKITQSLKSPDFHPIISVYKRINSTSIQMKAQGILEAPEWTCSAAEEQTLGLGKRGSLFFSPYGKGVYLSVLLRPHLPLQALQTLKAIGPQAVLNVLSAAGIPAEVDPERGILYEGKKIGGVLTECMLEAETEQISFIVVGIGLYVYQDRNLENHEASPSLLSLWEITHHYHNRSELIAALLDALRVLYPACKTAIHTDDQRRKSCS